MLGEGLASYFILLINQNLDEQLAKDGPQLFVALVDVFEHVSQEFILHLGQVELAHFLLKLVEEGNVVAPQRDLFPQC